MKPFFSFQWHITDYCDQRCKHCYIFSDKESHTDEMSFEDMERTLSKCLNFCETFNREPYFFITGGDPILHQNFWEFLELLKEKEIGFSILGNPFHLTPEVTRQLKDLGCNSYQLSIDGLEKTHDWFRKPGSFEKTLQVIPYLRDVGIEVDIMTTVSGVNKDEVMDIMDVMAENHADLFCFARYCPGNENEDNGLEPLEYRALLEDCQKKIDRFTDQGIEMAFSKKDHLWTLYEFEEGIFEIPEEALPGVIYAGCNCGNAHLTILPNGDILACRRVSNSKVGNILEDDLKEIWLDKMEVYREFSAFEKCSACELLAWCRGCPAVASAKEKGFYSSDPQCWKVIEKS